MLAMSRLPGVFALGVTLSTRPAPAGATGSVKSGAVRRKDARRP